MGASKAKIEAIRRAREVLLKEPWIRPCFIAARFGLEISSVYRIIKSVHKELNLTKPTKSKYINASQLPSPSGDGL